MSFRDFYKDEKTGNLKNLNGIKDRAKLDKLERALSERKALYPVKDFAISFNGFKAVHKHLFGEVYEWAGKSRGETVVIDGERHHPHLDSIISKGGKPFAKAAFLETETPKYFKNIKQSLDKLVTDKGLTNEKFSSLVSDHIGDLNHAHPFREGNGRTMRVYLEHLGKAYGLELAAREFPTDRWMNGSIKAMDGDPKPLAKLILDSLDKTLERGGDHTEPPILRMDDAGKKLANQMGLKYSKIEDGKSLEATYEGYMNLEAGTFLALKSGEKLSLLKVSKKPELDKGAQMNVIPVNDKGRFKIEVVRQKSKQKFGEKELER